MCDSFRRGGSATADIFPLDSFVQWKSQLVTPHFLLLSPIFSHFTFLLYFPLFPFIFLVPSYCSSIPLSLLAVSCGVMALYLCAQICLFPTCPVALSGRCRWLPGNLSPILKICEKIHITREAKGKTRAWPYKLKC